MPVSPVVPPYGGGISPVIQEKNTDEIRFFEILQRKEVYYEKVRIDRFAHASLAGYRHSMLGQKRSDRNLA